MKQTLTRPTRTKGQHLTNSERAAIASACATGFTHTQVAKRFNVTPETISRVLRSVKDEAEKVGLTWKSHLATATANSAKTMERATRKDWRAASEHLRGVGVYGSVSKHQVEGEVTIYLAGNKQPEIHDLGTIEAECEVRSITTESSDDHNR
jgi:hypothetical protein